MDALAEGGRRQGTWPSKPHRNAYQFLRGTAGWIKSSTVSQATPQQATEDALDTLDDVHGADELDDVFLDGQNLADEASTAWRPRLLSPPLLGQTAPATGQQEVDMETASWSALWQRAGGKTSFGSPRCQKDSMNGTLCRHSQRTS